MSEYRRRFALLSGGDHSLVATHFAMAEGSADEVIHVDTGIGIPECLDFVREVCHRFRWPLRVIKSPRASYEELVAKYGFPGPAMHYLMYRNLKEGAIRMLVRDAKEKRLDEIALISGVHQQESVRRMGFTKPRMKIDSQIWLAPLFTFSALDFHDYKRRYSLPTSPVKRKLGFSGECLCGAFAKPGEINLIQRFFPPMAERIMKLQDVARAAGKHAVWGERPRWENPDQLEIPFMPMCSSCPTRERAAL